MSKPSATIPPTVIKEASDVDMSRPNGFTNKWEKIQETCPWFLDMRDLIAQRPNVIPTGLGHSGTDVDTDIILPDSTAQDDSFDGAEEEEEENDNDAGPIEWEPTPEPETRKRTFSEVGSDADYAPSISSPLPTPGAGAGDNGDNDETPVVLEAPVDSVSDSDAKQKKPAPRKNPAKPRTSKPSTAAPADAKPAKKSKLAEFSDIAKAEEQTRKQELEVAALRARQAMKIADVKGRLGEKREDRLREEQRGKREERAMKYRLKELKMRQQHITKSVENVRGLMASARRHKASQVLSATSKAASSLYRGPTSLEEVSQGDLQP
ncbi:hypothetical protein B0H14DRAFT_3684921 [Mycena olivaceomarginata]|nr:hypothetical protein B0H14DRAFT_3684921 [Mycena olivaceomarginata]